MTIEYAAETLAEYPVAFEADGRQVREVGAPASTQPDMPRPSRSSPIWKRPRRKRVAAGTQARLFDREPEASAN